MLINVNQIVAALPVPGREVRARAAISVSVTLIYVTRLESTRSNATVDVRPLSTSVAINCLITVTEMPSLRARPARSYADRRAVGGHGSCNALLTGGARSATKHLAVNVCRPYGEASVGRLGGHAKRSICVPAPVTSSSLSTYASPTASSPASRLIAGG